MEILIFWLGLSILAGVIANNKGRSGFGFFLLALLLSPLIGIIGAAVASPNDKVIKGQKLASGTFKVCPFCAETIQRAALICPHCRSSIGSPPPQASPLQAPPPPRRRKIEVASGGQNLGAMTLADIQAKVQAGELDLVEDQYLDPETNEWQPLGVLVEA